MGTLVSIRTASLVDQSWLKRSTPSINKLYATMTLGTWSWVRVTDSPPNQCCNGARPSTHLDACSSAPWVQKSEVSAKSFLLKIRTDLSSKARWPQFSTTVPSIPSVDAFCTLHCNHLPRFAFLSASTASFPAGLLWESTISSLTVPNTRKFLSLESDNCVASTCRVLKLSMAIILHSLSLGYSCVWCASCVHHSADALLLGMTS